ncbi:MAG: phosphoribosylanthranilate isomerase [Ruminococcus sp.]|nr:phosphoribosylanthranilate isomerase [Ruminococcus sp.]
MTKIKFCGLTRPCDIAAANEIKPNYIGFVFAPNSKRRVTYKQAVDLKNLLSKDIQAVGVFLNEDIEQVISLLNLGIIDAAQLHGDEDAAYIARIQKETGKPVIKAFQIHSEADVAAAEKTMADYIILDAGTGEGKTFDWNLIDSFQKPYFLAGGLHSGNVTDAMRKLHPYALDVSTGIETDGLKDKQKMAAFAATVRKEETE